ncbi:outer membrane protein TolC [Streptacidiphilus sp. BW17]|uniref:hypothetical protein n=1 Tax=Streptacidiphilus sp. BW17 TaxID=3156274 RepID=UPI0035183E2A
MTVGTKKAVAVVVGALALTAAATAAVIHWWTTAMRPSLDVAHDQALASARSSAFQIQNAFQADPSAGGAAGIAVAKSLVTGANTTQSQTRIFATRQGPNVYSLSFALDAQSSAQDWLDGGQISSGVRLCLKLSWDTTPAQATLADTTCPAALRPFSQGGPPTNTMDISTLRG